MNKEHMCVPSAKTESQPKSKKKSIKIITRWKTFRQIPRCLNQGISMTIVNQHFHNILIASTYTQ